MRIDSHEFFLTYPRCEVPLQRLLDCLRVAFTTKNRVVDAYIISSEEHKDGGLHRHAYIRINTKLTNEFDDHLLDVDGHHPNIQWARNKTDSIGYVGKDGSYITNISDNIVEKAIKAYWEKQKKNAGPKDGKRAKIWQELVDGSLTLATLPTKYPCQGYNIKQWAQAWEFYQRMSRPKPKPLEGDLHERNFWLWGEPGVGKTKWVFDNYPRDSIWEKPADLWWTGYNDEENVLINDIGDAHAKLAHKLKNWTEHEPFNGQIHCEAPRLVRPQRFFVTSNYTISQWLESIGIQDSLLLKALKRRFKEIHVTDDKNMDIEPDWNALALELNNMENE